MSSASLRAVIPSSRNSSSQMRPSSMMWAWLSIIPGTTALPARSMRRGFQRHGGVLIEMLVAADDEAVGEIGIELQLFGLELAVYDRRILARESRVILDLHIEIGMGLEQFAHHIGRAKPDIVRSGMRP